MPIRITIARDSSPEQLLQAHLTLYIELLLKALEIPGVADNGESYAVIEKSDCEALIHLLKGLRRLTQKAENSPIN